MMPNKDASGCPEKDSCFSISLRFFLQSSSSSQTHSLQPILFVGRDIVGTDTAVSSSLVINLGLPDNLW